MIFSEQPQIDAPIVMGAIVESKPGRKNFLDYVPFEDWSLVFACLENGKAIDVPRVRAQVERMKYDLSEKDITIKELNEEWKSRCDYLEREILEPGEVARAYTSGLSEALKIVEKRAARNASRAKAMKEQFSGAELYGETEQTYLAFLREDSEIASRLNKLIDAVLQPNHTLHGSGE